LFGDRFFKYLVLACLVGFPHGHQSYVHVGFTNAGVYDERSTVILIERLRRRFGLLTALLACVPLLVACGDDSSPAPESTPSPTAVLSLSTAAAGAIETKTAPVSSPAPGEVTVGQIADRIAAAWPAVRTFRTTLQTTTLSPLASPVASPAASPAAGIVQLTIVDEAIQPGRRHRVQSDNGQVVSEMILVDGLVYLRGVEIPGATPVATDPTVWATLDPAALSAESPYRSLYEGMSAPILAPYAGLSADERERSARPVGTVSVGGRNCAAFQVADTTLTGERIDVVIAIGEDNLPCSIETRAGSSVTVTTFEYNLPLTIEPPN
jgi:hypothetical protein